MADATEKKYVDLTGLGQYDAKIKALINFKDEAALKAAKDYADGLAVNYDVAGAAATVQGKLDAEVTRAKAAEEANAAAAATAQTQADKGVADAAAAKTAADNAQAAADVAQGEVDALEGVVGTLPEGETSVVEYINKKTAGIASDAALTALGERVTAAEGEIDTLQSEMDAVEAKAAANESAIGVLNGEGAGSVKKQIDDAFNDFATKISDDGVVNTYKELVDYCATHSAEAAEMAGDIQANATAISELEQFVGTLPEGTQAATVIAYVNEKVAAEATRATSVESGLNTRLAAVEAKFGEGAGTVEAQIAAAVKTETDARIAADQAHDTAIAAAKKAGDDAQADVDALEAVVATKAAQSDLTALTGRVDTAEGEIDALQADTHTHDNKAVLDGIDASKVTAWDGAVSVQHTHDNKTVLDGITSAKVSAWDAAEGKAKAYTDAEIAKFVPVTEAEINALFTNA